MLVQLSAWQTTKTSIGARKRRKPSNSTSVAAGDPLLVTMDAMASFVQGQRRSRQRRKQQQSPQQRHHMNLLTNDDMVPQIILTTSHKASIVGHLRSKSESWQESLVAQHQYTTRPGTAFAYLASTCRIATVMDGRNQKLYALQNENKHLISWHATEGPEQAQLIQLPAAATCLHIRHGVVYGTCVDSTAFIGQWIRNYTTKTETFELQLIKNLLVTDEVMAHAHTVLEKRGTNINIVEVGKKRTSNDLESDGFVLYQVFCTENQIKMVKTDLKVNNNKFESQETFACYIKTDLAIDTSHVMATSLDNYTMALVVRLPCSKTDLAPRFRAIRLAMETCQIGASFELPSTTKQIGGISSSLLAVGTIDEILLYDALHGTLVNVEEMASVVSDTKDWRLITDQNLHRLVVLSQQNGDVFVSLATLENGDESYSLATSLQSYSQTNGLHDDTFKVNLLQVLTLPDSTVQIIPMDVIPKALANLRVCLNHILDPKNKDILPHVLMKAYECALEMVAPGSNAPLKGSPTVNDSPAKRSKNGVYTNGEHKPPNTIDTRGRTPFTTPQEFIDGATTIILQVLQISKVEDKIVGIRVKLARLDARNILMRLLQTGKISARTHFDVTVHDSINAHNTPFLALLRSIKLSYKRGARVFSPVDAMHEMLSSCPDLSEHHLVTMIHYMLCRALPEDIAENFIQLNRLDYSHPYTKASKKYFKERSTVRRLEKMNGVSVNSSEMKCAQNQVALLSRKLLKMGASFLMERVVEYSDCNESLLRTALQQGLSLDDEPILLAKLLLETLSSKRLQSASSKWIFALCDGCREQLQESQNGMNYKVILDRLQRIIQEGELILGLAQYLREPSKRPNEIDLTTRRQDIKSKKGKSKGEQIPDYCIEQLVF